MKGVSAALKRYKRSRQPRYGLTIGGRYIPINRTAGYARLGFCQGEKCPWHGKKLTED